MATTTIRVQRPDGTIEAIVKQMAITGSKLRSQYEDATRAAGRGEIIGWEVRQETVRRTADRSLYARGGKACRGCGRMGDDGECGLGEY